MFDSLSTVLYFYASSLRQIIVDFKCTIIPGECSAMWCWMLICSRSFAGEQWAVGSGQEAGGWLERTRLPLGQCTAIECKVSEQCKTVQGFGRASGWMVASLCFSAPAVAMMMPLPHTGLHRSFEFNCHLHLYIGYMWGEQTVIWSKYTFFR